MKAWGPLEGLKVLDLTTNVSGPLATQVLSGLGATVWKVERPDGGDDARQMSPVVGGESAYFLAINASKKSIALDLRKPGAKEVVRKLVERADILVENYRPRTAERLGVGWRRVHAMNPRLVYASISGYGGKGPDGLRAGYDGLLQARTGLLSVTGPPGGPPVRIGVSILDAGSGVWASLGILAALLTRDKTGRGQKIATSLFETGVFLLAYHLLSFQLTGRVPLPHGTDHPAFSPYGAFAAGGRGTIFIGISNDRQFRRLCRCLGHEEWASDQRYRENRRRVTNRDLLRSQLNSILRTKGARYWERTLTRAEVPASRLQNVREVLADAQAGPLSLFRSLSGPRNRRLKVPKLPLELSDFPAKAGVWRVPRLGEHTREILSSVGLTGREIAKLELDRVVLQS